MKTVQELQKSLQVLKPTLQQQYGVRTLGLFGSYVRGEQRSDSDVDILVEFEEGRKVSLFDFVGLGHYLTGTLGIKVDVVEKNTLKPRIGQHILNELVPV